MLLPSGPRRDSNSDKKCQTTGESYGAGLPSAVAEVLGSVGDLAVRTGVELFVKGGVACYYHTLLCVGDEVRHLALRPVSADIDWTCPPDETTIQKHLSILSAASGRAISCTEDREEFAHIVYGSKIARGGVIVADGSRVELDLIPTCRFAPDATRFMYEFGVEKLADDSRTPRIPVAGVKLNSREIILCEKLGLGRGTDLGKFDIVDAALLLAIGPIQTEALRETVRSQRCSEHLDGDMPIGERRTALLQALERLDMGFAESVGNVERLSMDRLKALALCARLNESLQKIDITTLESFFRADTPAQVVSKLQEGLALNLLEVKKALRALISELVG